MEFWFSEIHTPNVKLSIRVDKQLYSGQSEFQRIDVLETTEFGKVLVVEGKRSNIKLTVPEDYAMLNMSLGVQPD